MVTNGDNSFQIWVNGVAVNKAAKVGAINPMRIHLTDTGNIEIVGKVTRFVDTKIDPPTISPAYALSVPPHGSTPFHLMATIIYSEGLANVWSSGKYHADLKGWVVSNRNSKINPSSCFAFEVPDVMDSTIHSSISWL